MTRPTYDIWRIDSGFWRSGDWWEKISRVLYGLWPGPRAFEPEFKAELNVQSLLFLLLLDPSPVIYLQHLSDIEHNNLQRMQTVTWTSYSILACHHRTGSDDGVDL